MQITNGVVEYGRTVKPADYESKSARVALTFAVEEGATEEQVWQIVSRLEAGAQAEVHSRLGLSVGLSGSPNQSSAASPLTPSATPTAPSNARRSKAAPKTVTEIPSDAPAGVPGTTAAHSVVDIVDPTGAAAQSASPEPATAASIIVDAPEAAPSSAEIKNTEIRSAVHAAVEHKVPSRAITQLVAEFTGAPGVSMTKIAQDKRAEFIERLKALA